MHQSSVFKEKIVILSNKTPFDMNENKVDTFVVTIGRQFGCGGREIGRLVAQKLGIGYYDKELLIEVAQHSGMSSDYLEAGDEIAPRFMTNLWSFGSVMSSGGYFVGDNAAGGAEIYRAQSEVMRTLADRGPCVIVGRTADYVLRGYCPVVSVFVHADIEDRAQRIVARGDCANHDEALQLAEKKNRLRAEFYNFYTDKRWGDATSYDLCINSSVLGEDGTANAIVDFIRRWHQ